MESAGKMILRLAGAVLLDVLLIVGSAPLFSFQRGASATKRSEDGAVAYRQWLEEDVVYIITPEEASVFQKLSTNEERHTFIEQFWERRNPNPGSSTNEFKVEHYRRIQYANDHYSSGYEGWKTDRGRVYIMFGQPYHIEDHPGGRYDRPMHEGGGTTSAFPFQIWRYRYIPRIGSDIEIEFVDTTETGDYRIARDADEKDALLTMPGRGLTLDEQAGYTTKGQRIDNRFVSNPNYFKYMREQDTPFSRLYLRTNLDRPPVILNTKLREAVNARVTFGSKLLFKTSASHLRIDDEQALVLLNLEIRNRDIAYSRSELGIRKGVIEIFGSLTALNGRLVTEFEHNIFAEAPDDRFEGMQNKVSVYQKTLTLPPGVYKLELALKDRVSGDMGFQSIRLGVPNMTRDDSLSFSSLLLCRGLVPLGDFPDRADMFVLGNLKVIPSVDQQFGKDERIGIYAQLYNFALDQSSLAPNVSIRYEIRQGEKVVKALDDFKGETVAFASGQRLVLTNSLPTGMLQPGNYQLRIQAEDRLSQRRGEVRTSFTVLGGAGS